MHRKLLLLLFVFLIAACGRQDKVTHSINSTPEDTIKRLNIQPNNFVEIDTMGITMFPLSMSETVYDGTRSYKDMPNNDNWNILFYDTKSGKYHLLTDKKILIHGFYLGISAEYNEVPNIGYPLIFYTARTDDYNQDKLITEKDPLYLFTTDRSGKNFRQVSPSGYHLLDWRYIKHSNKIILNLISDRNRDLLFDIQEEHIVFENSLELNSKPVPIFPNTFIDSLKLGFGKYWHRIK